MENLSFLLWVTAALVNAMLTGAVFIAALRLSKRRTSKIAAAVVVVGILCILSPVMVQRALAQEQAEARVRAERQKYREAAWAHFRKRCREDARETIDQVVENVEAVFLLKPRRRASERELKDQFEMEDPYGYSLYEAMNPVGIYLHDRSGNTVSGKKFTPIIGYRYVETANPAHVEGTNQPRYLRYQLERIDVTNSVTRRSETRLEPRPREVDSLLSRYGITWEDISTPEDRKYWVAGGKLTVLDLRTEEIIGERTGYVIDPGLGSTAQGRRIWLAVGRVPEAFCPRFENDFDRNKEFVAKVLRASAESRSGR